MQQIVQGRGTLDRAHLTALMAQTGMQRPLLVCGARMQQVFAQRVGLALPVFDGYHPNPDLTDCLAGAQMYRAQGCDGLISLGGGSAMDTAKGVKALLLCGDMDRVVASGGLLGDDLPKEPIPHVAIPGTAGTGAEATPIAVVYVKGQKLSLDHPALLPEGALLDGSLLDTLPLYHKKACAMDALCQGIESWWAVKATEESRVHAARAVRGVAENYAAYLAGDADAQDALLLAAYESGCAIRISRTTAAHAMSYQITKRLGFAHGHACMLTLPHLWRHLQSGGQADALLSEIADCLGQGRDPERGASWLLGMLAVSDLLPQEAPDEAVLEHLTASVNVQRLGNHPETLTAMQLREIYVQAFAPMAEAERARVTALWRNHGC